MTFKYLFLSNHLKYVQFTFTGWNKTKFLRDKQIDWLINWLIFSALKPVSGCSHGERWTEASGVGVKGWAYICSLYITDPSSHKSRHFCLRASSSSQHTHLVWRCTRCPRWDEPGRSQRSYTPSYQPPGCWQLSGPCGCSSSSRWKPCHQRSTNKIRDSISRRLCFGK